jgi:aminoglycoside phosphotransferase family enzyme/predicted kinase
MNLTRFIEALSKPAAYLHTCKEVEVYHTHISVVLLAGPYAYKIKKPIDLGFLDFSSLEKRRHFCEEEVRLNRRLAPTVYLGVVPVTSTPNGLKMEGSGEIIEWAVKMERLPEQATLEKRLQRGEVTRESVTALAQRIAGFHAHAQAGDHISAFGRFEAVARNVQENFDQSASQVGVTLTSAVFERLRALSEGALTQHRSLIEARAARGVPRDTHGDLHLDHVYLFPERQPPADLVIVDCIEFNERFRYSDPVSDMAFLAMDLAFHGRRDLAEVFADSYFHASSDSEGRALLPLYTSYRAAVRGKVEGFELTEKEIPEGERAAALARAQAHWLLALGALDEPGRKPCLMLVGGVPGTGKSTLARGLAERADFCLIRSDVVRKELAGGPAPARSSFGAGIYDPAWTERTYAECLRRAGTLLLEGKRVVVDASFRQERRRRDFLELAARLAVPAIFIVCRARPEVIRLRLKSRTDDPSDADWSVSQQAAERWEELGFRTREVVRDIANNSTREQALLEALQLLRAAALLEETGQLRA